MQVVLCDEKDDKALSLSIEREQVGKLCIHA